MTFHEIGKSWMALEALHLTISLDVRYISFFFLELRKKVKKRAGDEIVVCLDITHACRSLYVSSSTYIVILF